MSASWDARARWDDLGRRARAVLPTQADWRAARAHPLRDVAAGVSVAVVALPLSLAYGQSSGMGAKAGLATAVVAGALAAVFGGGALQVAGPTAAMSVVVAPIVHQHGPRGVWTVGVLAAVLLIIGALTGAGRYMRCVPTSVVEGFAAGIAAVIMLGQVPAALGVHRPHGHGQKAWRVAADAVRRFGAHPHPVPLVIAVGVAALMLVGARWRPSVPFPLIGVAASTVAAALLHLDVARISSVPAGLPAPSLGFWDPGQAAGLLPSAFSVAALVALEGLLCAAVVDALGVSEKSNPDRELFGQGIANLVVPLLGGMPATAAIARTAVNVRCGARSRLAALVHAGVLAVVVYTAAGLVAQIPAAALAGVMLAAALRMIKLASMAALARTSRPEALVIVVTVVLTVAVNLIVAVAVGLALAALAALAAVAATASLEPHPLEIPAAGAEPRRAKSWRRGADRLPSERLEPHRDQHVVAYRLDGPLLFAAAARFRDQFAAITGVRVLILQMAGVSAMDASGAHLLEEAITLLEHRGISVLLADLRPPHDRLLATLGVARHLRDNGLIFPGLAQAAGHAAVLVSGSPPRRAPRAARAARTSDSTMRRLPYRPKRPG